MQNHNNYAKVHPVSIKQQNHHMSHEYAPKYTPPSTVIDGFEPLYDGAEYHGLFGHSDHDAVVRVRSLQGNPEKLLEEGALFGRALEAFSEHTGIPVVEHQFVIADTQHPTADWPLPTLVAIAKKVDPSVSFEQAIESRQHLEAFDEAAAALVRYVRYLIDHGGPVQYDMIWLEQMLLDEQAGTVTLVDIGPVAPYESKPIAGADEDDVWSERNSVAFTARMLQEEIEKLDAAGHSKAAYELEQLYKYMDELGIQMDIDMDELWDD